MKEEKENKEKILEEANEYNDVYKQPKRKKCALLGWWGMEKIIEKK
jgi:NifU-like protein involved in Fe-S cluster formation